MLTGMSLASYRTRSLDTRCPHCGGPLRATDKELGTDELTHTGQWRLINVDCPAGCLVTMADFPDGGWPGELTAS